MITGVVCSDDRMLYVSKYICSHCQLIMIDETTDFLTLPCMDILIFPVRGIDEDGYMTIKDHRMHVPSMFWQIQKDVTLFVGLPSPYMEALPMKKHYYMKDEQVIEENAVLTAEGVLHLLITSLKKSLYDIQVDVIGYGHCGKAIVTMLDSLDVKVRIIRRECVEDERFLTVSTYHECGDVIINTSIQPVLDRERLLTFQSKPVIIDIATPDVVDKKSAEEAGMTFIKAPNLPGRFCAESAGNIIADYVRGIVCGK